ncbi:MAG: glycosyltransferase family 4 protein [Lachnospiraceae bacterium]|nr:glycosyltransferase family 4 protein [Lachnospiraceae bacterium]
MDTQKKTILIVHNKYRIPGGEDVVAENEARLLAEHGHRVIRYTRDNAEIKRRSRFSKLLLPFEMQFSLRTYHDVRALIRREGVDIVHVHNTLHLVSPSVFYAAAAEKVPVVQTVHNFRMLCPAGTFYRRGHVCEDCAAKGLHCSLQHACYRNDCLQTAAVAFMVWLHRLTGICRNVHFICLTEFNKEKLMKLNRHRKVIDPGKVYVKPNFTLEPEKREVLTKSLPKKPYYVVIGRLEKLKGSDLIAKAFARNRKHVVFIGQGEMEGALCCYISRNHLQKVELAGQLSHEEAMRILANAEALITASQWYETFGMTVIEAYARKVPVIALDFGNIGDLVIDGVTGIKFKNSADSLNRAIKAFEKMDRTELGENAYRIYREKYSKEGNYRRLMEIYDAMGGGKS